MIKAQIINAPEALCADIFQPITWSRQDTLETRRQISAYNAARDVLCGIEDEH